MTISPNLQSPVNFSPYGNHDFGELQERSLEENERAKVAENDLKSMGGSFFESWDGEAPSSDMPSSRLMPTIYEEEKARSPGSMPNLGNTCWFNTLTHLFYPGSSYRQSLDELTNEPTIQARRGLFKKLLELRDDPKSNPTVLRERLETILIDFASCYDNFDLVKQQDVKERLDNLIDYLGLHLTATSLDKPLKSAAHFQAYDSQTMKLDRESKIANDALALCFPANCQSIQNGIEQFLHPQILDETMDFEGSKKPALQTIFYELNKPEDVPPTLTVQISRFRPNGVKDHTRVLLNPTIHFPFCDKSGTSTHTAEYALRFIACHEGESVSRGHYSAITSDPTKADNFYLHNDDNPITRASLTDAKETAYLLGYQFTRIDSNPHPLSLELKLSNFLSHHPQTLSLRRKRCQTLTYIAVNILLTAGSILYALNQASEEKES